MSDDLITWLRAALDEDEAWARAASAPYRYADEGSAPPIDGVHWRWVTGDDWHPVDQDPVGQEFVADGDPVWLASHEEWPVTHHMSDGSVVAHSMPATCSEGVQEMRTAPAGHIVRWDPARVLDEVAAKRRIINEAERYIPELDHGDNGEWALGMVVRVLALPYAGRPGYRKEWAP